MNPSDVKSTFFPIDIVIPTYKRGDLACKVALSILEQCTPQDSITIVAQDSDKLNFPQDNRITVKYLSKANLPEARNNGLLSGKNQIILFLDDDVIVDKNLLQAHRKCYENPIIGAVAGFIEDPAFSPENILPSRYNPSTGELVQNFSCKKSQYTISMMGANMSIRRDVFKTVGLFDTGYRRNALWEEIDMSFRLQNTNYRIWFCADAKVKHIRSDNGGCRSDSSRTHIFYQFSNTTYFLCKFSPISYYSSLFSFWKYRLEYESRKKSGQKKQISHDIITVVYGFCGMIFGYLRFLFSCKKNRLPDSVTTVPREQL